MTVDSHVTYMYSFSLKFNRKCRTHSTSRSLSLSLHSLAVISPELIDFLPPLWKTEKLPRLQPFPSFLHPSQCCWLRWIHDFLRPYTHSHIHVHHTVGKGCWESNLAQSRNCFPLRDAYGYMGLFGEWDFKTNDV